MQRLNKQLPALSGIDTFQPINTIGIKVLAGVQLLLRMSLTFTRCQASIPFGQAAHNASTIQ